MYVLLIFHLQGILETKFINIFIFLELIQKYICSYSPIQETICKIYFYENNWKAFIMQYLVLQGLHGSSYGEHLFPLEQPTRALEQQTYDPT